MSFDTQSAQNKSNPSRGQMKLACDEIDFLRSRLKEKDAELAHERGSVEDGASIIRHLEFELATEKMHASETASAHRGELETLREELAVAKAISSAVLQGDRCPSCGFPEEPDDEFPGWIGMKERAEKAESLLAKAAGALSVPCLCMRVLSGDKKRHATGCHQANALALIEAKEKI